MRISWMVAAVLTVGVAAFAQESASYRVDGHTFTAGGPPDGVTALTSASYRISLQSVGEPLGLALANGTTYSVEGGFGATYSPPGEVMSLRFEDPETLVWQPDASPGGYNLYRGNLGTIDGNDYGACAQQGLVVTMAATTEPVQPGSGFFYLVTALNLLGEESVRGFQSSGSVRTGTTCP